MRNNVIESFSLLFRLLAFFLFFIIIIFLITIEFFIILIILFLIVILLLLLLFDITAIDVFSINHFETLNPEFQYKYESKSAAL